MIDIIPPSVVKALDALATYEYMTTEHMVAAGVVSDPGDFRKRIRDRLLRQRKSYIERMVFNLVGKFRVHDVYCLTRHGAAYAAEILEREPEDIIFPTGGVQFGHHDYFHRVAWIHTHIALRNWANVAGNDVEFVRSYHTKVGSQIGRNALGSKAITRVEFGRRVLDRTFMEPDGIARINVGGKQRLCAIEVHRQPDTKRIAEQLECHIHAVALGTLSKDYHHEHANFILSVHERPATFDAVRQRMLQHPDFGEFAPLFLFNTLAQVKQDFGRGWVHADGAATKFLSS